MPFKYAIEEGKGQRCSIKKILFPAVEGLKKNCFLSLFVSVYPVIYPFFSFIGNDGGEKNEGQDVTDPAESQIGDGTEYGKGNQEIENNA